MSSLVGTTCLDENLAAWIVMAITHPLWWECMYHSASDRVCMYASLYKKYILDPGRNIISNILYIVFKYLYEYFQI